MTKYIFVTGGVVSSVGKGIAVASLGRILHNRGVSISVLKLDPYLNVDPGTMSPYQHGEVFVTADGSETDLDLGHYERFIDIGLTRSSNVTAGQIYSDVIAREREGEFWEAPSSRSPTSPTASRSASTASPRRAAPTSSSSRSAAPSAT